MKLEHHEGRLTEQEARDVLNRLRSYLERDKGFAEKVAKMPFWQRALQRLPSLVITLVVELFVVFVLSRYEETVAKAASLIVFLPLVSAVAGNYGLQCGVIVTRALAVGTLKEIIKELLIELGTVGVVASVVSVLIGGIAFVWLGSAKAALVVAIAQTCALVTATFSGTLFPYFFSRLNIDPALIAGPAECTVQDTIGYIVYLTLVSVLLL